MPIPFSYPFFFLMVIFRIYPIIYSFGLSFLKIVFEGGAVKTSYVGFENWAVLISDPFVLKSFMITAYFTGLSVGIGIVFSLGVALLLNKDFRGKKILSTILLIPWAIPSVVSGQVWKWIFNSQYGILNTILLKLNIISERVTWLFNPDLALYCVVFAQIWNITPFMLILFLSSLATVPKTLYDAALVDGANRWQSFRHVTFPWIRTTFFFVLILEIMWSFKSFDLIYVLTRGGPYDSTTVVYLLVYKNTFEYFKFGIGAALAYLLAIVILILTWLMYRFT